MPDDAPVIKTVLVMAVCVCYGSKGRAGRLPGIILFQEVLILLVEDP